MATQRRSRAARQAAEARRQRRDALRRECAWLFSHDPAESTPIVGAACASAPRRLGTLIGAATQRAYEAMISGIRQEPGLYLLTGTRGVGKSYLLQLLPIALSEAGHRVVPSRASLDLDQFLAHLSVRLEIAQPGADIGSWLERFRDKQAERKAAPVLVIDDADLISNAVLSAFPPLLAADLDAAAALRIVLAGRPGLGGRISARPILRERMRQWIQLEPLTGADVASLLAEEGVCPPFAQDSIAALVWHARGLPGDLRFLLDQSRRLAEEGGRAVPALEDVEHAANLLRPSTALRAAPARVEAPPRAFDLSAWLTSALDPRWAAWQQQLIAHARGLRATGVALRIVAIKHSLSRICSRLERRAVAFGRLYRLRWTVPVERHPAPVPHARWRERFFGPALYGGVAVAAAALVIMVQLGDRASAPVAPEGQSATPRQLASTSSQSRAPAVVLPIAPPPVMSADGRSQLAPPPLDLSSRIVMAEPLPSEPPMDVPNISQPTALAALAPALRDTSSQATAGLVAPPQPVLPSVSIQPPPMPSIRVAGIASPRAVAAGTIPAPAHESVALDTPRVRSGSTSAARTAAPEPGILTASLVTGEGPQCQPYRSKVDYAGHPAEVSGLACRDSSGQWWLMNQAN